MIKITERNIVLLTISTIALEIEYNADCFFEVETLFDVTKAC